MTLLPPPPPPPPPQASNRPLRGGKDTNLEGGVRTLAALGGGWLPPHVRGSVSSHLMHESDWYATLAHLAGVSRDDGGRSRGVPAVDSVSMWPSWRRLERGGAAPAPRQGPAQLELGPAQLELGPPRTIVLSLNSVLAVRPGGHAYKLIAGAGLAPDRGLVCECPECRATCLPCNASGGCLFDVARDPSELRDLAPALPEVRAELRAALEAARAAKFVDRSPINQECWAHPKAHADYWLELALARGATMQPWLRAANPGSARSAKPRLLHAELKPGLNGARHRAAA